MKKWINTLVIGPWNYWVGAIILAILNILVLITRQRPWGITKNIEDWSMLLFSNFGFSYNGHPFMQLLLSTNTLLNIGIVLGALLATLIASQGRLRLIRKRKYLFLALFGGFLMGYGARIAYGCNIGAFMNGIASGSLSGWIFGMAIFLGAWIGTRILLKYYV